MSYTLQLILRIKDHDGEFETSRKTILEAIYSIFQQSGSRGYFITNLIEAGLNFARQAVVTKNTLTKSIYPPQLSNQATYHESTTYPLINHSS